VFAAAFLLPGQLVIIALSEISGLSQMLLADSIIVMNP